MGDAAAAAVVMCLICYLKSQPENDPKRFVVVFSVHMFDGKAAAQWRGTDVAAEEIISFNTPTSICLFLTVQLNRIHFELLKINMITK